MRLLLAILVFATPMCYVRADEAGKPSKQDSRRVWVLTDQGGVASEGGLSTSGPGGIIPYEITCAAGELVSMQRKLTATGNYGAATWTVRISASLASEYGTHMLRAALENICKSR
jgi:hypothetical protein